MILSLKKLGNIFFYKGSDKLYILAPYWHGKIKDVPMRILEKRILKSGYSCLVYQFPIKILSDNVVATEKYFKKIQREMKEDIENIKKEHNFKEIILIGISLGCVNATMVANDNKNINKLILVVPGDSLSQSLWKGIGTKKLKSTIKKHNINLEKLEKDWKDLEPKNNINKLFDKEIEIYLSRSDKIIPYINGSHLVKEMKSIGLNPIVFRNNKLGHYLTPLKFILMEKF